MTPTAAAAAAPVNNNIPCSYRAQNPLTEQSRTRRTSRRRIMDIRFHLNRDKGTWLTEINCFFSGSTFWLQTSRSLLPFFDSFFLLFVRFISALLLFQWPCFFSALLYYRFALAPHSNNLSSSPDFWFSGQCVTTVNSVQYRYRLQLHVIVCWISGCDCLHLCFFFVWLSLSSGYLHYSIENFAKWHWIPLVASQLHICRR